MYSESNILLYEEFNMFKKLLAITLVSMVALAPAKADKLVNQDDAARVLT